MPVINKGDLGRLLRTFRERRKISVQEVETRLTELVKQADQVGGSSNEISALSRATVTWLETVEDQPVELSEKDLDVIAAAYQIPRLMLDPLQAEAVADPCLVADWGSFVPVGTQPGTTHYGRGARYSIPRSRLRGTAEIAVVQLEIEPGGTSDSHNHPGDELMLVLDGEVEVRLEDSGLWTRLGRHGYIHFYAEQIHSARNASGQAARVLVVRFYQLGTTGTRGELAEALGAKQPSNNLTARLRAEMEAALSPFTLKRSAAEVRDRYGLARLLRRLCSAEFQGGTRLTLEKLVARVRDKGYKYPRPHLDRLHHGQVSVTEDELPDLAEIYGTEPLILYPLIFPALRQAVAVRRPDDLRPVPARFLGRDRVEYWAPCRRLADSDMSIAVVRLAPGESTPRNRHPGQEILVPLEGSVEVVFDQQSRTPVEAGRHAFAHYLSGAYHLVSSTGGRPAELFVIRFYGD